jgi:alginate O-acetyltransferase complex protein AlgI
MTFTSLPFLVLFLPLVWILYFIFCNGKSWANPILAILSLLFYSLNSLSDLFILVFVLIWNWLSTWAIAQERDEAKRKRLLLEGIAVDVLLLALYKYIVSLLPWPVSFAMPIGLSFYTFSCMSSLFDIYWRKAVPLANPLDYCLFAAFFGRVNMGPIVEYHDFVPQLKDHPISRNKFETGSLLIIQGLAMKVLLADNLASLFTFVSGNSSWLGRILLGFAYFFQLYFDFAGYSRMAIGIGAWFGFETPENFHLPYAAHSVQDFWRRWHMSLTKWFTHYVYIPLGGNRVDKTRWILNILAVWILTGIWHGSSFNFILWGLFQAMWLLIEKAGLRKVLDKLPGFLSQLYVILTQLIGWTFFFSKSMSEAFSTIGSYFGIGVSGLADASALFALKNWLLILLAACFFGFGSFEKLAAWLDRRMRFPLALRLCVWILGGLFVLALLVSNTNQPFLYAAF